MKEHRRSPGITEYDEGGSHFFFLPDGSLCEVRAAGSDLIIEGMALEASSQDKGLGAVLLRKVEQYARQNGCTRIIEDLQVDLVEGNMTQLYVESGFSVTEEKAVKLL